MASLIPVLRHSWQESHNKGLYYGFRDAILSFLVTMYQIFHLLELRIIMFQKAR